MAVISYSFVILFIASLILNESNDRVKEIGHNISSEWSLPYPSWVTVYLY